MKHILLALALSLPVLSHAADVKFDGTSVSECHSIPNKTSMHVKFDHTEKTIGYGKRTFKYTKSVPAGNGVVVDIFTNKYDPNEFFMTLDNPADRDRILFVIRTAVKETDAGFCNR